MKQCSLIKCLLTCCLGAVSCLGRLSADVIAADGLAMLNSERMADIANVTVRVVRYAFSVQNLRETALPNVRLQVMAPVLRTPAQHCLRLTSRPAAERAEDDLGNRALVFTFPSLGPYATEIVRIEAEIALRDVPLPAPLPLAQEDPFVMPERYIESTRPEIVALATANARETVSATVNALNDWVATNIQRDLPTARDRGARSTLEMRRGDCTDMAYLLAALCRANNIPARVLAGFVVARNVVLRPDEFHNWIEFHDGTTWHLADPFAARFKAEADTYVAIRILDGRALPVLGDWQRFQVEPQGAVRVRMLLE